MVHLFRIISYNILADSYINPQWYPHIAPELLKWEKRKGTLQQKIEGFEADILCLQEVEEEAFAFIDDATPLPSASEPSDHLAVMATFMR
jgi:mRNA deadenylase 3'-5' endonuclease subunit Ccr4